MYTRRSVLALVFALGTPDPDHPVVLTRIDGHATLVNAAAMRAANVTVQTQDPAGGRFERGADNSPTPPELILTTNVVATYLAGRAVYQKPAQ